MGTIVVFCFCIRPQLTSDFRVAFSCFASLRFAFLFFALLCADLGRRRPLLFRFHGSFSFCAVQLTVLEQLTLLEKALLDEHQYKTGKAALDSELKALLASNQTSLEPNDEVCTHGINDNLLHASPRQPRTVFFLSLFFQLLSSWGLVVYWSNSMHELTFRTEKATLVITVDRNGLARH